MTPKDLVLIAAALEATRPTRLASSLEQVTWAKAVREITQSLANTNERFNKSKFLEACGFSDSDLSAIDGNI